MNLELTDIGWKIFFGGRGDSHLPIKTLESQELVSTEGEDVHSTEK